MTVLIPTKFPQKFLMIEYKAIMHNQISIQNNDTDDIRVENVDRVTVIRDSGIIDLSINPNATLHIDDTVLCFNTYIPEEENND